MTVSAGYLDFVLSQLESIECVTSKRMFGGAGLWSGGLFFGLIAADVLYFKVDETNAPDYESAGMAVFSPFGTYSMAYRQVPPAVLEDSRELRGWAEKALEAASRKSRKGSRKKSR
ncbi:MAG: TfoX/Sxy family protein [Thermodesulfobacteriota bacterium]